MTLAALFIAQATDIQLSIGDQILLLLVAMLSSKGAAGITGAGFITLAATLSGGASVPVAGMALILGIDRFMSECRSLTNFIGNAVATVVVARWEKVTATKPMLTQRDLSLAYSPGVAHACEAILADPQQASELTARGNLVAVISNGTAVLGLGNIGPLAGKPVMEGKGVLFQKFAGIDVFDIEINENDPDKLVDIIASLEPTFGGINLEDIKAPECFIVERKLRERMNIPVFHDDQHGTAIIVGAAVLNAMVVTGKKIEDVKLATTGMGAAGVSCVNMLVSLGLRKENILAFDRDGVIHTGRTDLDPEKARYARDTDKRTLAEIVDGADIFLGLSAPGILTADMVKTMAKDPVIFALANPTPEIMPEVARSVRPDALIGTGRSDYPNQINNVLCFPYLFRGALDVGATAINEEMKIACVHAIAAMARREASDLGSAYGDDTPSFGRDYLIPRPVRPPPAGGAVGRRGAGRDGFGRGRAPRCRHGCLPREAGPVRLPHQPDDEAGVRPCARRQAARGVRRRRRRSGAACGAERGR
jgi:malic enzyme